MAKEDLDRSAGQAGADQPEQEVLLQCSLIDEGFNYRRRYNAAKMASLRADIRAKGLIYPIIVRRLPTGRYQLLVGNRRFKAVVAEFGPDATIKAKVRQLTDAEAMALMMSENGEREDPSVIEDAEGAARMLGLCNGNRDEAAARLGWDRKKLDRRLALMNATQGVRDAYLDEKIGVGHVEILAALRKEVQDRVIDVILKQPTVPTVDQLKAMAEQSLQSLEAAIFDRADCAGCQFNTGNQQALFEQSFSGSRCTNKECYGQKTDSELEARAKTLKDAEAYQVVRIVRPGDNSTLIPLRADGKHAVGEKQALACKSCADFGACVSAVPDSLGKTYTDICFNKTCHDSKVKAFVDEQRAAAAAAEKAATAGAAGASGQEANSIQSEHASGDQAGAGEPDTATGQERPKANPNAIRPVIKEYREGVWRLVFERAALKLSVMQSRALLVALIVHRSSYLNGTEALDRINKATGANLPTFSSGGTKKLLSGLLEFDQKKLADAFQQLPAFVSKDMPIADIVGLLKALDIKIEQFWKVNETFFDMLTKSELDAVCQEIGLAKAAGKTYASLKNGSKKDFVAAMLKVQGFTYEGAIPKLMRWTSGV